MAKRRRFNKRFLIGAGVVLALLIAIGALGSGGKKSAPSAGASKSPSPTASATTSTAPMTPLAKLQAALSKSDAKDAKVTASPNGPGTYLVTFKVEDNLSHGLIRTGIALDTFDAARKALASGVPFTQLWFDGTFPVVDKYGKQSTDVVYHSWFKRATLQKIQFDNINRGSIDTLRSLSDGGVILKDGLQD